MNGNGHHTRRAVDKNAVVAASRTQRNRDACKRYYQKNRLAEAKRCHSYYLAHKDEILARGKLWREKNRDKIKIKMDAYHIEHAEDGRAKARAWARQHPERKRLTSAKWYAANKEHSKEKSSSWKKSNPALNAAASSKKHATALRAMPKWANEFFIREAYILARLRTRVTGIRWDVDHIVPLQSKRVCGLHCEQNLQVIPALHNQRKQNIYWPEMP